MAEKTVPQYKLTDIHRRQRGQFVFTYAHLLDVSHARQDVGHADLKAADLLVDAAQLLSDQLVVVQATGLRLLAQPEPLPDLRHEAGHRGDSMPLRLVSPCGSVRTSSRNSDPLGRCHKSAGPASRILFA